MYQTLTLSNSEMSTSEVPVGRKSSGVLVPILDGYFRVIPCRQNYFVLWSLTSMIGLRFEDIGGVTMEKL